MDGLEEISGLDQESTPSIGTQAHSRETARRLGERHGAADLAQSLVLSRWAVRRRSGLYWNVAGSCRVCGPIIRCGWSRFHYCCKSASYAGRVTVRQPPLLTACCGRVVKGALNSGNVESQLVCNDPRQQFVYAIDRMLGDASDHETQVGFGIHAVQFGGLCRVPNYAEWFSMQPTARPRSRCAEPA